MASKISRWTGSVWTLVKDLDDATVYVAEGNAQGIVAVGTTLNAVTSIGAGTTLTGYLSFTMQVGRRYRVVYAARAFSGGSFHMTVWDNSSATGLSSDNYIEASQNYGASYAEWIFDGDGVARTFYIRAVLVGGTPVIHSQEYGPGRASTFYIEDMGPNTTPALPIPATPPAWTTVTGLLNSWVAYDAIRLPKYRKIGDEVQLRGLIRSGTIGTNAFILPAGFRPDDTYHWAIPSGNAFGIVRILVDGAVEISIGSNAWVDLTVIRFSTTS